MLRRSDNGFWLVVHFAFNSTRRRLTPDSFVWRVNGNPAIFFKSIFRYQYRERIVRYSLYETFRVQHNANYCTEFAIEFKYIRVVDKYLLYCYEFFLANYNNKTYTLLNDSLKKIVANAYIVQINNIFCIWMKSGLWMINNICY